MRPMIAFTLSMVGLTRKPLSSATSSPCRSGGTASHQRSISTELLAFMSAEILATVGLGACAFDVPLEIPRRLRPDIGAVDRGPEVDGGHDVLLLLTRGRNHNRPGFDDDRWWQVRVDVRHDERAEAAVGLEAGILYNAFRPLPDQIHGGLAACEILSLLVGARVGEVAL